MSIWKNTEVRRTALWLLLATAVCSVAAALLYPICGLLTLGLGAVCGAIWYGSTRRRYRELERMSRDIDRILHGQEQQVLPQQEEGELAILRSEIGKMTVRLRENAQRQQEERVRLADAMADISHQLRTPLTAMRLTLSLLEQEELTPQRRLALMRELKKLTGRMEWLVEALLKMASWTPGRWCSTRRTPRRRSWCAVRRSRWRSPWRCGASASPLRRGRSGLPATCRGARRHWEIF